jgi:hypothetical protein
MSRTLRSIVLLACAWGAAGVPASAQYSVPRSPSDRALGEAYWVELSADLWNPVPAVLVTSESLGIPGTPIDFVADLGITKTRLKQFQLVLRPAKKHKFRVELTPIRYAADTVLTKRLVFNGIAYQVGLPVEATLDWRAWRLGYEYDFVYRSRGFVGVVFEAKYTDVQVNLASLVANEFARARAPIPAIGGIGRVYVARNAALTFEVTGVELPDSLSKEYRAHYVEYDLYGTVNFGNNVGAQVGYRAIDVGYTIDLDSGDLLLKGPYFGLVVRF